MEKHLADESTNLSIRLELSYEFNDVFRPPPRLRRTNYRAVAVWSTLCLLIVAMAITMNSDHWSSDVRENIMWISLFTVSLGFLASAGIIRRGLRQRKIERQFRRHWASRGEIQKCSVELSPVGVVWESDGQRVEQEWRIFTKYTEEPDAFWLHAGPGRFKLIPKRFISTEQLPIFMELLRRYVGPAVGLPVLSSSELPPA